MPVSGPAGASLVRLRDRVGSDATAVWLDLAGLRSADVAVAAGVPEPSLAMALDRESLTPIILDVDLAEASALVDVATRLEVTLLDPPGGSTSRPTLPIASSSRGRDRSVRSISRARPAIRSGPATSSSTPSCAGSRAESS
jgi:hypothetical protein